MLNTPWVEASKGPHVVDFQVSANEVTMRTFLGADTEHHYKPHASDEARRDWQSTAVATLLDRFEPPETR